MLLIDCANFFQFDLATEIMRGKEWVNFPNISIFGMSFLQSKTDIITNRFYYLSILYCSNNLTAKFFSYTFKAINFGITWDLYNSVRNPFDSTNSRHEKIMIFAPFLFFVIFIEWFFHYWIDW